jgi:serine/threonine protein kinase
MPDIKYLFSMMAEGILYFHRKGFAHMDLKPDNVLLTRIRGALPFPLPFLILVCLLVVSLSAARRPLFTGSLTLKAGG